MTSLDLDVGRKASQLFSERTAQPLTPTLSTSTIQRAQSEPSTLHSSSLLQLQQTIGNQAVQRLLYPHLDSHHYPQREATTNAPATPTIQRALKVGAAHDRYEQEAERMARQMVNAPQRIATEKSAQPKGLVQRQAQGSFNPGGDFEHRLQQTKSSGKALSKQTRAEFEPILGADLSGVRVHTNADSKALNRDIQAKAFTHGNDIHFSEGAYNPASSQGKQLLAHELTHTIQQTGGTQLRRKGDGKERDKSLTPAPHATIQRKLNFTADDLYPNPTSYRLKKFFSFDTSEKDRILERIEDALNKYHAATSRSEQMGWLTTIKTRILGWLNKGFGDEDDEIAQNVQRLYKECRAEIQSIQEQKAYIRDIDNPTQANMKYLTKQGHQMTSMAKSWQKGTDVTARGTEATALIRQHKLSRAETTGIGMYTAEDFMYMNPAIAGGDSWMTSQLTNLANPDPTQPTSGFHFGATEADLQGGITQQHKDEAKEAGLRHAKFALQGMAKLPKWQSPPVTYRGRSETPAKIASDYQVNQTINFPAFASSSVKRSVAENFAMGNLSATSPVPLLIILTVTNGRDIAKLSLYPGEGEILLLPGASFDITQSAPGTVGGIPGHIVHAVQTT